MREFREATEDLLPIMTDRQQYTDLILDLSDNGRVDDPEKREKIQRTIKALQLALV